MNNSGYVFLNFFDVLNTINQNIEKTKFAANLVNVLPLRVAIAEDVDRETSEKNIGMKT